MAEHIDGSNRFERQPSTWLAGLCLRPADLPDSQIGTVRHLRQACISVATQYQWKSKYGGVEASDLNLTLEKSQNL